MALPYTMLRHPIYSEFFIHPGLQLAVDAGELTSSTGGRGLNTATRADLAEAAAAILSGDGHANRGYEFTGRLWTYPELADVLSAICPADHQLPGDRHRRGHHGDDRPRHPGRPLERQTEDLEQILGRPATSLRDAVAAVLPAPRRSPVSDQIRISARQRSMTPGTRRS